MSQKHKCAVLPAAGIGDALLMLIASHQLQQQGWQVTTFHHALPELATWFSTHHFAPTPTLDTLETYDRILVENDNSPRIVQLCARYRDKLSIFYPTYQPQKHAPLSPLDHAFSPHLSMAENIARALSASKDNGITAPAGLQKHLHPKRIVLHPTSREAQKNWFPHRFLKLAQRLKQLGYEPVFSVSPAEREQWLFVQQHGFALPQLPSLASLATLIYESGALIGNDSLAAHLASNLAIPALVITNDPIRLRLWRPDWLPAQIIFPPFWLPKHWRHAQWQRWISVRSVLKAFHNANKIDIVV